jgi:hypothetical protein
MVTIKRRRIMARPVQAFLDWLHRADPMSSELSLEHLRREPTVYLLPECEKEEEAREYLEEMCGQIFEERLDNWYRVPSAWPNRRDLDAFNRWVEWSSHTRVVGPSNNLLLQRGDLNRTGPFSGRGSRGLSFGTLRGEMWV